jgi:hypothetical protein
MDRRFQLCLRNALLATFWMAVTLAALAKGPELIERTANEWANLAVPVLLFALLGAPAAAVGSICGRPRSGALEWVGDYSRDDRVLAVAGIPEFTAPNLGVAA